MYITKEIKNKEGHKFIKDNKIYEVKNDEFVETDEYDRSYKIDLKVIRRVK